MSKVIVHYSDNSEETFDLAEGLYALAAEGDWLKFRTVEGKIYMIPSHEVYLVERVEQ